MRQVAAGAGGAVRVTVRVGASALAALPAAADGAATKASVGLYVNGAWRASAELAALAAGGAAAATEVQVECGGWSMVEAVLLDADGWKAEGAGTEAWVRVRARCGAAARDAPDEAARGARRQEVFERIYQGYLWEPQGGSRESRSVRPARRA